MNLTTVSFSNGELSLIGAKIKLPLSNESSLNELNSNGKYTSY